MYKNVLTVLIISSKIHFVFIFVVEIKISRSTAFSGHKPDVGHNVHIVGTNVAPLYTLVRTLKYIAQVLTTYNNGQKP